MHLRALPIFMVNNEPSRLNPALREFWRTKARYRVLLGGRASSKSWDAAGFAIYLASNYRVRFLCARQFQNRIADSVYALLEIQAERFKVHDEFHFTDNSIIHKGTGSEFLFYGIARNLKEIKSTENIDIFWLEEGDQLDAEQWKLIEPTVLRKQGSQAWIVFNPRFASDFVYQRFIVSPPPKTISRHINWDENPFLSDDMREIIINAKEEDEDEYNHVYLGIPLTDDERVIIKRSWIEAAIDAHIKLGFEPEGRKVIGFDVADDGDDKCANVEAHGSVALWCEEWKGGEDELLKSCSRTYLNASERGTMIRYDCIGVGAGAGAKFDELNQGRVQKVKYAKFNAGDAVHEPERFYVQNRQERIKNKNYFGNLKSQTWWLIADRFRNTYNAIRYGTHYEPDQLISISSKMPHLEKLKTELSTPRRDFDQNGRVKVESKKDLAKRNIASPNIADAFVMCFAPEGHGQIKISNAAVTNAARR
jgi:phage terminase large subunit